MTPGDHLQVSTVLLFNRTSHPVHVLAAAPTWQSEQLVSDLQRTRNRPGAMGTRSHVGTIAAPG